MNEQAHRRPVVVLPAAEHLRRSLGLASWAVLEELLAVSAGDASSSIADTSVRAIAASLGVAKDTVARAFVRLRQVGLVVVEQRRTGDGVFGSCTYTVSVPSDMFDLEPAHSVAPPRSHRTTRTTVNVAQLSLIEA
jgi:hypothetical protein